MKISVKSKNYFGQFCFWAHKNLDAPCGSKIGLLSLDWCDGGEPGGGAAGGKRFRNCLIPLDFAMPAGMVNFFIDNKFDISLQSSLSMSEPLSDSNALGTPNRAIISSRNIFAANSAVMVFVTGLQIKKWEYTSTKQSKDVLPSSSGLEQICMWSTAHKSPGPLALIDLVIGRFPPAVPFFGL